MGDATVAAPKSEGAEAAQEAPPTKVRSRFKGKPVFRRREIRIACTSLVLVSFILLLIAITTNNWMGDGQMSVGLWYACLRPLCARTPTYIHPGAVQGVGGIEAGTSLVVLKVVHTMLFVAIFFALGSISLLSVSFFRTHIKTTSLSLVAGIASILAGTFIMIGMSVYTYGTRKEKVAPIHSEWSFFAGWISCSLFLLAGLVTLLIYRTEPVE